MAAAFALLKQEGAAPPATLIQASASGWYGLWPDLATAPDSTEDAPAGSGFLADVTRQWEASSAPVEALGGRRVRIRTAPVLGKGGGILTKMLPPSTVGAWAARRAAATSLSPGFIWMIKPGPFFFAGTSGDQRPLQSLRAGTGRRGRFCPRSGPDPAPPSPVQNPRLCAASGFGPDGRGTAAQRPALRPRVLLEAGYVFRYPDLDRALRTSI